MNTATLSSVPLIEDNARINGAPVSRGRPLGDVRTVHVDSPVESESPSSPGHRRPTWVRALALSVVLVVLAGVIKLAHGWWTQGRFIESTDDSYVGGDVTVIAPKVPGFIAELAVADNQPVHAGDLLLRLDDRDYRAALARTDATVSMQQATLANLDATRHLQEAMVAQAEAEIASTEAEISRAHDDQIRYRLLVESATVSTQSFQQADTVYKQAVAGGAKARAALAAAQRGLDVIATQKQQAQAALEQARADRDIARLNLGYTEVRSPIDGIVGNRSARTGAYASTGSQLISLVPTSGLWIDANFKESQLARIRPGSPALVRVDSLAGRVFRGRVVSVAPATGALFSVLPPENATGNFTKIVQRVTVRIVLDEDAASLHELRPGLSVTAEVDGRSSGKAVL